MQRMILLGAIVLFTTIWGNIDEYTNRYVVVSGTRYPYGENVIIDTYSLHQDRRGNVRVELDAQGRAKEVFFYGIDMPQAAQQYKRH